MWRIIQTYFEYTFALLCHMERWKVNPLAERSLPLWEDEQVLGICSICVVPKDSDLEPGTKYYGNKVLNMVICMSWPNSWNALKPYGASKRETC
ncbi:5472_t:CDS:2 [Cetraspora pellucida]|uniref:5472_t:CDS:1 n=1 Tax=Cetraspora pellucida TaxID=1433469 RepID=A0ACA9K6U7_9GLOM|nr:5472_t:CDS:2 [Cetraspora pellucida]